MMAIRLRRISIAHTVCMGAYEMQGVGERERVENDERQQWCRGCNRAGSGG